MLVRIDIWGSGGDAQVPKAMVAPSIQMSSPRFLVLEHSAWYVGMAEVFMPLPMPATIRPTVNWT